MTEPTASPGSSWYEDPGVLLGELQRGKLTASRLPVVAGYDDFQEIRRGGQGEVYSAFHRSMKRRVAIKVLLDRAFASEVGHLRFEREIDLVATLQHPNIVRVYDRGVTADGKQYFSMEYIEGVPLDEFLKAEVSQHQGRAAPNARDALRLFVKICAAVSFAHQKGVIHRDLKPSNILIDAQGEPHVLDFGLAKVIGSPVPEDAAKVTTTGEFMGTLAYAAPEQLRGDQSAIDVRTDVYALGVILYEMLTGERPFPAARAVAEVVEAVTQMDPQPPTLRAGQPRDDEIDTIVLKTLAKDPERRYQSAAALREDIERYLNGEPIEAKRDSRWYLLKKMLRRHRVAATLSLLSLILVVGFGLTMAVLYRRAATAEALAQEAAQTARTEAQKAELVGNFLEGVLSSVDPNAAGRDVLVRDVLDAAAVRLETEMQEEPEVQAALHQAIGNAYRSLGLYDEAETQLRAAVAIHEDLGSADPLPYAESLSNLGAVQGSRAEFAEAERLYRTALAIYREHPEEDDALLALTLNNLGGILFQAGRLEEAAPLYREALALNRERLGNETHPDMAFNLILLAGLQRATGDFEEAEVLSREALSLYRELLGDRHPTVAYCRNLLALTLQGQDDYESAEPLFRKALAVRLEELGEDHPDVANSLHNLAVLLHETGRAEEAEEHCRRAIDVQRRSLPPKHPDLARSLLLLGRILLEREDYAGAETYMLLSHDALVTARGEDDRLVARARRHLARLYQAWGKPDQAMAYQVKSEDPDGIEPDLP